MGSLAARDLGPLFDPRSVAVIGASDDHAKWGYGLARQLLSAGGDRRVYLVNRRGAPVLGHPTLRRLTEVDEPVDAVAICVPRPGFLAAVRDALAVGARALVAITAGLGEDDEQGRELQAAARDLVRAHGAVLVGPNCLGVVDTTTGLCLASDPVTPGSVAVLSQSGNLVLDLDAQLAAAGLGISRFVSVGNQADLTLAELIYDCARHDGTAAVAVYVEDLREGRTFVAAARAATTRGKPVVVLAPGRSEAARRGAASHTGSLTTAARVVDAVCVSAGAYRVDSPAQLTVLLQALLSPRRAAGPRVAVLTDGGGHGAIAADVLAVRGLQVPPLSAALGERLRGALGPAAPVGNPVDLAGAGERDLASYQRAATELLASGEVDAVLMTGYFGGYALDADSSLGPAELAAAHGLVAQVARQHRPLVAHTIFPHSESVRALARGGVPVYRDVADAAAALCALVRRTASDDPLTLPLPVPPLSGTDYPVVRAALQAAHVPFPQAVLARDADEVAAAAATLGYPLVLKATGLLHKSDAGGVVLDITDQGSLLAAYDDLVVRLGPRAVSVEQMADVRDGVELIVGVRRDERCGPVAMVGLGGILAEVLDDVAFALAPLGRDTARDLLLSLRGAPLLRGTRGRPAIDVEAAADVVVAVADFAVRHLELAEVEVNPVLARPVGALALDARAVAAS